MADVPFLSYSFAATGAPTSRTLPDRLADTLNVKDFGAAGDGETDDTAAIQACFDAAYGPVTSPHGLNGKYLNKPVFFPAGNYITTRTLNLRWVLCAWIAGAGSKVTSITYKGPISRTTKTNIVFTDGFAYSCVEGMSFVMTGGNSAEDKTVCFNWNWHKIAHPNEINTTHLNFVDVGFYDASFGILIADTEPFGFGEECDCASFYNCVIDNCDVGLKNCNWNALQSAFIGGRITNCPSHGIWNAAGSVPFVVGVLFANNGVDNRTDSGDATAMIGCYSTSPYFHAASAGKLADIGCQHLASSVASFVQTTTMAEVTIDSCRSLNGRLFGQGGYYIRDSTFENANWLGWSQGPIHELNTLGALTFDTLPTGRFRGEGLLVSISDSPTAIWGASVTAGGGTNHVWLRWNGSNWTVVGK